MKILWLALVANITRSQAQLIMYAHKLRKKTKANGAIDLFSPVLNYKLAVVKIPPETNISNWWTLAERAAITSSFFWACYFSPVKQLHRHLSKESQVAPQLFTKPLTRLIEKITYGAKNERIMYKVEMTTIQPQVLRGKTDDSHATIVRWRQLMRATAAVGVRVPTNM